MHSKKLITTFAACALLLVSVGSAQAFSFTHNRNNDNNYNLSPEKAANVERIYERNQTKLQPLQDDLYAKRLELNALAQNPNTKPETIKNLAQEITELRKDIRAQSEIMSSSLDKETGMRSGYHRNGRGMGGGSGHNRGGGYGHNGNGHRR